MEPSIYSYSLCIALPLMSFFGFYFLLASTPGKAIFNNYLRSRRIMGVAYCYLQPTIRYISFLESGSRIPMPPS